MFVAKIITLVVNVDQQIFAPYGRGLIIPKHSLRQWCPPLLLHTISQHVGNPVIQSNITPTISETSNVVHIPQMSPIVPKHYGYSKDNIWEITMSMDDDRKVRRNHMSHIRSQANSEEQWSTS